MEQMAWMASLFLLAQSMTTQLRRNVIPPYMEIFGIPSKAEQEIYSLWPIKLLLNPLKNYLRLQQTDDRIRPTWIPCDGITIWGRYPDSFVYLLHGEALKDACQHTPFSILKSVNERNALQCVSLGLITNRGSVEQVPAHFTSVFIPVGTTDHK